MVDEERLDEEAEEETEKEPTWLVVLQKGMAKELIAWVIVIVAYLIYCLIVE